MNRALVPLPVASVVLGIDIGKTGGAALIRGRSAFSTQWAMKSESDTETAFRIATHINTFFDFLSIKPEHDLGIISILTPTVWRNIELFRAHTFVIGALSILLREACGPNCIFTYLSDSQARKELGLPSKKEAAHKALPAAARAFIDYDRKFLGRTPDERDALVAALASLPSRMSGTEALDW